MLQFNEQLVQHSSVSNRAWSRDFNVDGLFLPDRNNYSGWPIYNWELLWLWKQAALDGQLKLNIYKIRDDVYFNVTVALEYLGLQKQVKKHGFSSIDKFLSENGKFPLPFA